MVFLPEALMDEANVVTRLLSDGAGIGVWTLVLLLLITLVKSWPALRKLGLDADGSLRKDLLERIRTLEEALRAERAECNAKFEEQKRSHDNMMAQMQGQIDGLMRQLIQLQQSAGGTILLDRGRP
jgi:hypothetical protein